MTGHGIAHDPQSDERTASHGASFTIQRMNHGKFLSCRWKPHPSVQAPYHWCRCGFRARSKFTPFYKYV